MSHSPDEQPGGPGMPQQPPPLPPHPPQNQQPQQPERLAAAPEQPKSSVREITERVRPPHFPDPDNPSKDSTTLRVDGDFRPVSENLIKVRYLSSIVSLTIALIVTAAYISIGFVFGLWDTVWYWFIALVPGIWLLVDVIGLFLIPRQVRAHGWAERDEDLLIKEGLLFRSVVAIPYGRLQYLDLESGPILRHYGICTVTIRTASSDTAGVIQGVPLQEAERMRDELTARGQARMAGL